MKALNKASTLRWCQRNLVLTILAALWTVLILVVVIAQPSIFSGATLGSILQFATLLALVSLGQALVVLCGGAGIDLSVGGNVSLSAIVGVTSVQAGLPPALLPVVCLLCGALLGALNGILVARLRIYPLIVTLGTFYLYSGLALCLTDGAAQSGVPAWALPWGRGMLGDVPLPFLTLVLPAFVIVAILLSFTSWGRWIYAMGFNEHAARLVGIPVDRMRIVLYSLCGLLAGAASFVSLSWLGSGRPDAGVNLELESLTAALLGGIAIFGGKGGVSGVFAAVLLLVALKTSMLQFGINSVWQVGVVGLLLIAVLLADRLSSRVSQINGAR
ncbi:ABC transporter permease [Rouxiella chamberiensis]|uniref:Autoinducer 2 import system permease protein LsrC n=1 Tax=Rouxiella chamberiensis TaxID=1513468 RepID=A0ABY7HR05_9GAMM|nr:ABC transporter permease [Rouxiella chamberiensis]WAT01457.1 ABC transporter permease [Rouxiella chamberiensis]